MKKSEPGKYRPAEKIFLYLLVICLFAQAWYLWSNSPSGFFAQGRRFIHDGTGGPSAPAQPGEMQPPGSMFPNPGGGQRIEPPPQGEMQPRPGAAPGSPGSPPPGMRPGGRVTTYPKIPKGRKLTERDKQIIETRYILHRWVLSDLLWGVVALEKSKDHKLTDEQVRKIYPAIKKLATSVEVVEESNRLMKGLLRDEQIQYFEEKLYDGSYMSGFMAKYSPGTDEPVFGVSDVIYSFCKNIVEKKAKQVNKK